VKRIPTVLVALILFFTSYIATLLAWFLVFPVPKNCPPPCDAPGYVLMGVLLFVAPIVGVVCTAIGLWVRSRLWRRKMGSAA